MFEDITYTDTLAVQGHLGLGLQLLVRVLSGPFDDSRLAGFEIRKVLQVNDPDWIQIFYLSATLD